jgi:hypothetical protein
LDLFKANYHVSKIMLNLADCWRKISFMHYCYVMSTFKPQTMNRTAMQEKRQSLKCKCSLKLSFY